MPGSEELRRASSVRWLTRRHAGRQARNDGRFGELGQTSATSRFGLHLTCLSHQLPAATAQTLALVVLILAALMPFLSAATAAERPTFQELEESLTCQCGCGLTVASCNHLQCPSAIPLRQEIRSQMARGLSKQEILAYFADKYGEKILSSPTTAGFNLTAWVIPFVALAAGGLLVGVTLVRWRKARRRVPAEEAPPKSGDEGRPSPYEKILERELKQFDV